ncbi:MAG: hypothetical protein AAF787_17670 [Chloroflexota bacterium]
MRKIVLLTLLLAMSGLASAQDTSTVAYTYHNPDGNSYFPDATGTFPEVQQIDAVLDTMPLWVVGGLVNGEPVWTVALLDGRVVTVDSTGAITDLAQIAPEEPIAAIYDGENAPTLLRASDDASPLSHPVRLPGGEVAYNAVNGDLVILRDDEEIARLPLNLQVDARLLISDTGLLATYTDSTVDRYVHAIMGDDAEAAGLAVIAVSVDDAGVNVVAQVTLPGDDIYEGIAPLWADIDDDGTQEIVTTVSNGSSGATIRVYEADGTVLADAVPIGQGFRWRQQIAVAPFGINGETQLVDIRTPHIGGMVEFFDLEGDTLVVNNAQLGYTSHAIGSRNLDMGVAADFNGNGKPELVVTDHARQNVTAVENTQQGVTEVWRLPLDNTITTNIAAITLPDGTLALAVGNRSGVLRIWQP